jgi:GTPase
LAVLGEIGANELPLLEVYNKLDLLEDVEPQIQRDAAGRPQRVWLSARDGRGLDLLRQAVAELLGADVFSGTLRLPQQLSRLRAQLFAWGRCRRRVMMSWVTACYRFVCNALT